MQELVDAIVGVVSEAENGNPFECVNIASEKDPEIWVQIAWDLVNVSYPFADNPTEHLKTFDVVVPENFELVEWEPELHATWECAESDPETSAAFALAYLGAVYKVSGNPENLVFERQEL